MNITERNKNLSERLSKVETDHLRMIMQLSNMILHHKQLIESLAMKLEIQEQGFKEFQKDLAKSKINLIM